MASEEKTVTPALALAPEPVAARVLPRQRAAAVLLVLGTAAFSALGLLLAGWAVVGGLAVRRLFRWR